VFAEDISDFQIEGMSIGDSLLDHFTKEEINNGDIRNFPDDKFFEIELRSSNLKEYDSVTFNLKSNDNNYIIYGIVGTMFYFYDSNKCIVKKNEIENDISSIIKNTEKIDYVTSIHWYDKSKKSTITQIEFLLDISNDSIVISCYDWSEKITKELLWTDNLSIELYAKEFADFLREQN